MNLLVVVSNYEKTSQFKGFFFLSTFKVMDRYIWILCYQFLDLEKRTVFWIILTTYPFSIFVQNLHFNF